jgi:hypothetical protein
VKAEIQIVMGRAPPKSAAERRRRWRVKNRADHAAQQRKAHARAKNKRELRAMQRKDDVA